MFYDRFLDLCNKKGVKPSRVAVDTNFNKGSVSVWKKKYEKGIDVKPTTDILNKIAEYFDVSVDYLLGNSDERKPINKDITADDIKFALFGGDSEYISDESYEDVLAFAKIIAEKEKRKRAEMNELN